MKPILLPFSLSFCFMKPILLLACPSSCYMKPILLPLCRFYCYMKPILLQSAFNPVASSRFCYHFAIPSAIRPRFCCYLCSAMKRILLPFCCLRRAFIPKLRNGGWPCTALRAQYGQPLAGEGSVEGTKPNLVFRMQIAEIRICFREAKHAAIAHSAGPHLRST